MTNSSSKLRLLVTGGAGLLGSNLIYELNRRGITDITIVDRLGSGSKWRNLVGLRFSHYMEVDEYVKWLDSAAGKARTDDIIIHMGACSSTRESDASYLMVNNFDFSRRLMDYAVANGIRFVYASSAATYGAGLQDDSLSPSALRPLNPYALSKNMVDLFAEQNGFAPLVAGLKYFNCYDEKTEVLTINGFKWLKDVTLEDTLATLNPVTQEIEYHRPTHVHKVWHKGDMIHFKGRQTNILCTPDQNLYASKRADEPYQLIPAKDIIADNMWQARLKTTAIWKGREQEYEVIPACIKSDGRSDKRWAEKRIPMSKWLTFLGWFLSEGSLFTVPAGAKEGQPDAGYRVNISQHTNKAYIEEIYDLAKEIGFAPYRTHRSKRLDGRAAGINIHSKQLYLHLERFRDHKYIPREVLELNSGLLEHLYVSLQKGDGHKGDKTRYSTKYDDFADQFQELLLKTGRYGYKRKEVHSRGFPIYRIDEPKHNTLPLGVGHDKAVRYILVPWDDWVYDVTVPNHTIFIRREGAACWSGNCFGPNSRHKGVMTDFVAKTYDQIRTVGYATLYDTHTHGVKDQRDFLYVKDAVDMTLFFALDAQGQKANGLFNIGSGAPASWTEVAAHTLIAAIGYKSDVRTEDYIRYQPMPSDLRSQYQYYTCADISKLRAAGYSAPITPLADAIKDYVTQYLVPDKRRGEVS